MHNVALTLCRNELRPVCPIIRGCFPRHVEGGQPQLIWPECLLVHPCWCYAFKVLMHSSTDVRVVYGFQIGPERLWL